MRDANGRFTSAASERRESSASKPAEQVDVLAGLREMFATAKKNGIASDAASLARAITFVEQNAPPPPSTAPSAHRVPQEFWTAEERAELRSIIAPYRELGAAALALEERVFQRHQSAPLSIDEATRG